MRIRMHSFTFYIRFYSHPIAFPLFTILPSICNLHELPDSTGFYILLLLLLFPFARCFLLLIVVGAISLRCGKWSSTSSGEDLWCYIMADCGEVDMAIIIMPSNRSRIQGMLCMTGWGGGIRWSSVVREMIHICICMYYMHGCMSLITITNHYNRIKLHLSICDSSRQRSEKKSRKKNVFHLCWDVIPIQYRMNTRASNVHHRAPPVRRFCADSKCTHIELWCMLASTFFASSRSNARSANRRTERPSNSVCIVLYCFPFSTNGAHVHKHVRRPSWATNDVCVCVC